MNGRILIVDGDELTSRAAAFALRTEGFAVETAANGSAALESLRECAPDLVVLELTLPGDISGLDLCRELRARSTMPIVVVTTRHGDVDKVVAFERGADDFVVKPCSLSELVARVGAHLRRLELDRTGDEPTRRVGDLEIDLFRRRVSLAGRDLHLTPSEFELLALLSERTGGVFTRREIVARLWSSEFVGDMRSCDAHVARLRRKIERDPRRPERIVSVRGLGYRLEGAPLERRLGGSSALSVAAPP